MRVAILSIGLSNLFSISSSLRRLGAEVVILEKPTESIDAFVFPGVGNFTEGARKMREVSDDILSYIKSGRPFLGICLGMQMLFEASEEGPGQGLGVFKGRVERLKTNAKIPHMGWNTIIPVRHSLLTEDIEPGEYVYFMHSYAPQPSDERTILAVTSYTVDFPSIVGEKAVFGTQFHPEKSGKTGQKILKNFLNLSRR